MKKEAEEMAQCLRACPALVENTCSSHSQSTQDGSHPSVTPILREMILSSGTGTMHTCDSHTCLQVHTQTYRLKIKTNSAFFKKKHKNN